METIISPKLKWEKFEEQLGTWAPKIKPFFDAGGFEPIYAALKERSRKGKKIAPLSDLTFRTFRETPIESMKVMVLGMCPYHTEIDEGNGKIQVADGIPMSCGNHTKYMAPSLHNLYEAFEEEFEKGICLPCDRPNSLKYLCNQGVLLTNAALTTEIGKAGIHLKLWRPFTKFLIEEVIAPTGVPLIFLGTEAQYFSSFAAPMQWKFELSHPASAAYKGEKWDSMGTFSQVNKIIFDTSKDFITWLIEEPPF